jgi:hypothetical protein
MRSAGPRSSLSARDNSASSSSARAARGAIQRGAEIGAIPGQSLDRRSIHGPVVGGTLQVRIEVGEPDQAAALIAEHLGVTPTLGLPWAQNGEGYGQVKPSTLFSGGDPTSLVERIHWHGWGQQQATGDGTGDFVWPGESVARGSIANPAKLVAWDLGSCGGQLAYRRLTWYFPRYGNTSGNGWWLDPCPGASPRTSHPVIARA